jgi:lysophospholipase L1-like esterase
MPGAYARPMRRHILSTLVLSLFLGGFASADLLVKAGDKVAFMGDSITDIGWNWPGGYVKLTVAGLEKLGAKVVPIPAGVGGNTSRDMIGRLKTDVLDKKPDWLTLSCGVNDVWHGAGGCTLDEYKKNITAIVDQAQAAGIKVLIMTATVIDEDQSGANNKKLVAYNDFLRQLATERHLPLADENAAFQDALKGHETQRPYLTMDGVHPNTNGAQVMARSLLTGFGASPAQLDQVQQAWMDLPDGAFAHSDFGFSTKQAITIKQYNALQALAESRKMSTRTFLDSLFLNALGDAIKAHQSDPKFDIGLIQTEAQNAFAAKLTELAK